MPSTIYRRSDPFRSRQIRLIERKLRELGADRVLTDDRRNQFTVFFRLNNEYRHINTCGQAYDWIGYPKVSD
jgi:hypothetical protein